MYSESLWFSWWPIFLFKQCFPESSVNLQCSVSLNGLYVSKGYDFVKSWQACRRNGGPWAPNGAGYRSLLELGWGGKWARSTWHFTPLTFMPVRHLYMSVKEVYLLSRIQVINEVQCLCLFPSRTLAFFLLGLFLDSLLSVRFFLLWPGSLSWGEESPVLG